MDMIIRAPVLCAAFASFWVSPTTEAAAFYLDLSAAGSSGLNIFSFDDPDPYTSLITSIAFNSRSKLYTYDTNNSGSLDAGDRFLQESFGLVTALLPAGGDKEGVGFVFEITFSTSFFGGTISSEDLAGGSINFDYEQGGSISFFFDETSDSTFGSGYSGSGFDDGIEVMTLQFAVGSGVQRFNADGSFGPAAATLIGDTQYALPNFWMLDGGDGLIASGDELALDAAIANAMSALWDFDFNTDIMGVDFSESGTPGPSGYGNLLFTAAGENDASVDLQLIENATSEVELPAPPVSLLFGAGIVALIRSLRSAESRRSVQASEAGCGECRRLSGHSLIAFAP